MVGSQRLFWVGLVQPGLFYPLVGSTWHQKDVCELELKLRKKRQKSGINSRGATDKDAVAEIRTFWETDSKAQRVIGCRPIPTKQECQGHNVL